MTARALEDGRHCSAEFRSMWCIALTSADPWYLLPPSQISLGEGPPYITVGPAADVEGAPDCGTSSWLKSTSSRRAGPTL